VTGPPGSAPAASSSWPGIQRGTPYHRGVPKVDLKRAYLGAGQPGLTAQTIFTNRVDEAEAFARSIGAVRAHGPGTSRVEDTAAPRRNLLACYGMGGVGKSTLSRELERRFVAGELPGLGDEKRSVIRIDFDDAACRDILTVVLRLRAGLAEVAPRWPAFDLVLASYWERARPGEPIAQFLRRSSMVQRLGGGMADQVEAIVDDVLAVSGIVNTARRAVGHVSAAVREARARRGLLAECPLFGTFLDAEADDELLSFMPWLLAWDLERLQQQRPILITVFLDTFERIQDQRDRSFECQLMRLVHAMPNVLFVVTGRSRLDWAEEAACGGLDLAGSACWPGLTAFADQEPRQHLVGLLSPRDCGNYLSAALRVGDAPALSDEVRDAIVTASEGLPLYLDVAVDVVAQALGRREPITPALFEEPLPGLVARVMRGLSPHEQDLARAAALLGAFDGALLRAVAPRAGEDDLHHFLQRSFVQAEPRRWLPYSMHEVLREAVRARDGETGWPWPPERWRAAAVAGLEELRERSPTISGTAADRERLTETLVRGITLADTAEELPPWLIDLVVATLTANLWTPVAALAGQSWHFGPVRALVEGMHGAAEAWTGDAEAAERRLVTAIEDDVLSGSILRFVFMAERGFALRRLGLFAEAEAVYEMASAAPGEIGQRAGRLRAYMQQIRGDHPAAAEAFRLTVSADQGEEWERHCNLGGLHLDNGLFDAAVEHYRRAEEMAQRMGSVSLSARVAVYLAETLCWSSPDEGVRQAQTAVDLARLAGLPIQVQRASAARAVAAAGSGSPETVDADLRAGAEHAATEGLLCAETFCRLVIGDDAGARAAAGQLAERTGRAGVNRWASVVAQWWLEPTADPGATSAAAGVRWLDGDAAAAERWRGVLARRLAQVGERA
jgi:tetratricopeptide (TPR) repeat protein